MRLTFDLNKIGIKLRELEVLFNEVWNTWVYFLLSHPDWAQSFLAKFSCSLLAIFVSLSTES